MIAASTGSLVVDASLAVRLVLANPHQARARALFAHWQAEGQRMLAPALWQYEVTSALTRAVHAGQLTAEIGESALALLGRLGLQLVGPDEEQTRRAFEWTLRLRRAAAYDSFYLALADQLGCPLWTADKRLHNAAQRDWVRWLDDPALVIPG